MATPYFSVIIPIHNRADLIGQCLNSVYSQTFQDFEIIAVDDGSTDDIATTCAPFMESGRLLLIRQENKGASAARNAGIDMARGKYVALLDSDDQFLPDHLRCMKALARSAPEAVIYSPVIADRGNGRQFIKPPRAIEPGESMATYLMCDRGFVQTSGICLPTGTAKKVRYRQDARYGDDTDFAIRLQLAGCQFVMAPKPTVIWADDLDHLRLSNLRTPLVDLPWLEDLRALIPSRAYHAYRGWHLAKSLFHSRPLKALGLYCNAVRHGAYPPRLAVLVFLQIVLTNQAYRMIADSWLSTISSKDKTS